MREGMHCWLQNMLASITPVKSLPLLDFTGEISVGKEKKKTENEDRGKGDKSRETRATSDWLAADGLQRRL